MLTEKQQEVKTMLLAKFNNMGRAANILGYELAALHNIFKVKEGPQLLELEAKAKKVKKGTPTSKEITPAERKQVQAAVKKAGNNVNAFCRTHSVDAPTVRRIMAGNSVLKTKLVEAVLEATKG